MKIILDVPRLILQPHGGLLYVELLVRALVDAHSGHEFVLHTNGIRGMSEHAKRLALLNLSQSLQTHAAYLPDTILRSLGERLGMPNSLALYGQESGIVHAFGSRHVPRDADNLILTLQDVIALKPTDVLSEEQKRLRETLRDLATRAKLIITISQFSRYEICNELNIDPGKILVIPDGVETYLFHPLTSAEQAHSNRVLGKYELHKQRYLLFLGGSADRKNLPRLIQAFDQSKNLYGIEDRLVVIGCKSEKLSLQTELAKLSSLKDISFLGYLEQSEVVALLQNAKMLVFPSLYEGFGLPPLEAMACGVPVAVSNASSIPEVVGDAGIYFDPYDIQDMAKSIARLANDPDLRLSCIDRGLFQSRTFSWERAAQSTLEAYEHVVAQGASTLVGTL